MVGFAEGLAPADQPSERSRSSGNMYWRFDAQKGELMLSDERVIELRNNYRDALTETYWNERNRKIFTDLVAALDELIALRKGIEIQGTVA